MKQSTGQKQARGVWGRHVIAGPKHDYRERTLMKLVTRHEGEGASVLDIGSGSGSLLLRLAEAGYRASGVEISEAFVKHTRDVLNDMDFADIVRVEVGQAEKLHISDSSVDSVVLAEVLEHLPNDGPALDEAHRVLKENGLLFLTVPANPALWTTVDEEAGHCRRYTREGLTRTVTEHGFKIVELRWWGFPITRLYEKILFRPWARTRAKAGQAPGSGGEMGKLAKHPIVRIPLSWVLSIDENFKKLPFGIGLMVVAKKYSGDE